MMVCSHLLPLLHQMTLLVELIVHILLVGILELLFEHELVGELLVYAR